MQTRNSKNDQATNPGISRVSTLLKENSCFRSAVAERKSHAFAAKIDNAMLQLESFVVQVFCV